MEAIMCAKHHRHSIHCILPPYILTSIATNGTEEQKTWALSTVSSDQTFRAFRASAPLTASLGRRLLAGISPTMAPQRQIFDAQSNETLPGLLIRAEGGAPTGDPAADEAYDGLGATHNYFRDVHQRNSIDGSGMDLRATVHYGNHYENAFWNGRQMVFGDGDGQIFRRFTCSLDIIAHELGHGVNETETGLVYMFQPGALDEHLADVWGSLVKQWTLRQDAATADWLIGADLLGPSVNGIALRSMKAPGTAFDDAVLGRDPQPGHMDDFVTTWHDNGGVHINSGIPNRAFYLAASALGGYAWEKAGAIWYHALFDPRIKDDTDFARFAQVTIDSAAKVPGSTPADVQAVTEAWAAVGVAPG
jgi:Zn-dependent metalloprotease